MMGKNVYYGMIDKLRCEGHVHDDLTHKIYQCSRKRDHGKYCWQHARMRAQDGREFCEAVRNHKETSGKTTNRRA